MLQDATSRLYFSMLKKVCNILKINDVTRGYNILNHIWLIGIVCLWCLRWFWIKASSNLWLYYGVASCWKYDRSDGTKIIATNNERMGKKTMGDIQKGLKTIIRLRNWMWYQLMQKMHRSVLEGIADNTLAALALMIAESRT